jgi:CRP-like cAMP-binding protein
VRIETFSAGDKIISQGEEGDSAFQILEGSVEVKVGDGKQEKTVGSLSDGEIFGEMSLIDPGPRSATVVATSDTKVAVTSYDEFMNSMQTHPERAVEFMKTLVRRLRQMNEQMVTMDPKRRGFLGMIRDWQDTVDFEDMDRESMAYWSYRYL